MEITRFRYPKASRKRGKPKGVRTVAVIEPTRLRLEKQAHKLYAHSLRQEIPF